MISLSKIILKCTRCPQTNILVSSCYWLSRCCDIFPIFSRQFRLHENFGTCIAEILPFVEQFCHFRGSFGLGVNPTSRSGSTYIPYSCNLGPIREVQCKWLLLPDKDGRLMSHTTPVYPYPHPDQPHPWNFYMSTYPNLIELL